MSDVLIYHNPKCSKSRQTLELIRQKGFEPQVKEYLKEPITAEELGRVLKMLGKNPQEIIRSKESLYEELGLAQKKLDAQQWLEVLVKNPSLIERPIVISKGQAALGRPPENVLQIL